MRYRKIQGFKDLDAIVLYSRNFDPNVYYFSGYSGAGVLVIPKQRKPFLIVPEMEYEKANSTGLKTIKVPKKKKFFETLAKKLKINKKIGVDKRALSVLTYEKLKKELGGRYYDVSEECFNIRSVKDLSEIKKIKKACAVTDSVYRAIISDFKFKTEKELKTFIESHIKRKGCGLAFPPIVASAPGSSNPHYDQELKIKKGFLVLDFGARYQRYCSDMSRTLYVGKATQKEKEIYNLLLKAQDELIQELKLGQKYAEVFFSATKKLGEFSEKFIHSLGHGLGIDIHEPPALNEEEESSLRENQVFTIEPGIYFYGKFGIRIEDTVLFQNGNARRLTKSSKKLLEVQA